MPKDAQLAPGIYIRGGKKFVVRQDIGLEGLPKPLPTFPKGKECLTEVGQDSQKEELVGL